MSGESGYLCQDRSGPSGSSAGLGYKYSDTDLCSSLPPLSSCTALGLQDSWPSPYTPVQGQLDTSSQELEVVEEE